MKTIRRFGNIAQAGFARSLLEAAGIPASLADEHAYTLGPQYAPWGIRLQVPEEDEERATKIIEASAEEFAPLPDDFEPPPAPPEPPAPPTPAGGTVTGAIFKGGIAALVCFGFFAALAIGFGGRAHADAGGLLMLFLLGGAVGLIVRAIYRHGWRKAGGAALTETRS